MHACGSCSNHYSIVASLTLTLIRYCKQKTQGKTSNSKFLSSLVHLACASRLQTPTHACLPACMHATAEHSLISCARAPALPSTKWLALKKRERHCTEDSLATSPAELGNAEPSSRRSKIRRSSYWVWVHAVAVLQNLDT